MIPSIKSELPNSFCTQFEYIYIFLINQWRVLQSERHAYTCIMSHTTEIYAMHTHALFIRINGSTPNVQKYFSHPRSPRLKEWHMIHKHIHVTSCINTIHFVYVHGLKGKSILAVRVRKNWYLRVFIEGCISVPTITAVIFLALPPMATYIVFYYDTWIIWGSTGLFRVPTLAYDLSTWEGGMSD